MQCSVCHYDFTMREVQAAVPCPRCEQRKSEKASASAAAVVEGLAPHVNKVVAEHRGAQPVVVMDIHMSFNSMVWFMVKWVIASIPAMAILAVLAGIFYALVSAVPAFFEYMERAEALRAVAPSSAVPERIVIPVGSPGEFYALAVSREDEISSMTVRSVFPGDDVSYSRVVVDCAKGTAAVVARSSSLDKLGDSLTPDSQKMIPSGTPRQYIAMHACRGFQGLHPLIK